MIDIEEQVFAAVKAAVIARYATATVTSNDRRTPASFPAVSIIEADNYSYKASRDTASNENHAVVMYEVNVYSNKADGKKAECKQVMSLVDTTLQHLGFTRTVMQPILIDDATIYRIVARYEAIVGADEKIYRG